MASVFLATAFYSSAPRQVINNQTGETSLIRSKNKVVIDCSCPSRQNSNKYHLYIMLSFSVMMLNAWDELYSHSEPPNPKMSSQLILFLHLDNHINSHHHCRQSHTVNMQCFYIYLQENATTTWLTPECVYVSRFSSALCSINSPAADTPAAALCSSFHRLHNLTAHGVNTSGSA